MSGADYATVRADGVVDFNAHYLLQADDGTYIYIVNRGYLKAAPGGGQPMLFRVHADLQGADRAA